MSEFITGEFVNIVDVEQWQRDYGVILGQVAEVLKDDGKHVCLDVGSIEAPGGVYFCYNQVIKRPMAQPLSDVPINLYDTVRVKSTGEIGIVSRINAFAHETKIYGDSTFKDEYWVIPHLESMDHDALCVGKDDLELVDPDELIEDEATDKHTVTVNVVLVDNVTPALKQIKLNLNDIIDMFKELSG